MDGPTLITLLMDTRDQAAKARDKLAETQEAARIRVARCEEEETTLAAHLARLFLLSPDGQSVMAPLDPSLADALDRRESALGRLIDLRQDLIANGESLHPVLSNLETRFAELGQARARAESDILAERHTWDDYKSLEKQKRLIDLQRSSIGDMQKDARPATALARGRFETDPVFSYLLARSSKKTRGPGRWMDRLVGKWSGFDRNKTEYDNLAAVDATFGQQAEILARHSEALTQKMANLDELALYGSAMQHLREEHDALREELGHAKDSLTALDLERHNTEKSIETMQAGVDPVSREATVLMTRLLQAADPAGRLAFLRQAKLHGEAPDLVRSLDTAQKKTRQMQAEQDALTPVLARAVLRADRARALVDRCREKNLHRHQQRFGSALEPLPLIEGVLDGAMTEADFFVLLEKTRYSAPPLKGQDPLDLDHPVTAG